MNSLEYNKKLIAFNSTSVFSNAEISDYVEDVLKKQGFATERLEYSDSKGVLKVSIVGKKGEGQGGMAYFGHTDVVPADTWFSEEEGPFTPVIKGDRLYGRGSSDMKGSVACMLAAAEKFSAAELEQPVYITCTADEEVGYHGAIDVVARSELYREMVEGESNGIIGEPTNLEVVYAHKGTHGLRAISRGRASHSSTREGLNANLAMIPYLVEMKKIHDETEADPEWHNNDFDPPTICWNIGINDHTHAVNITAPQSICTVYFRVMPGQDPDVLIDRVAEAASKNGLDFEVAMRSAPVYVEPDSNIVKEALQIAGKQNPRTVSFCTDGAKFTDLKKMIIFGPGNIAQAHTNDEWITLEQLELGAEMYEKLIRHWCCSF